MSDSTFCYLHIPDEILPYIVETVDEWEDPFLSLLPTNDNLTHATVVPLQGEETDEIPLPYHIQPPQPLYDDYTLPSDRHPSYPFGKAQAAFVHLRPGPGAKNVASHLSQADLQRFLVTPLQEQSLSQAQLQGRLNLGHWSDLGLEELLRRSEGDNVDDTDPLSGVSAKDAPNGAEEVAAM